MSTALAEYLAALQAALKSGAMRAHTHRPAIHRLLKHLAVDAPRAVSCSGDEAIGARPLQ